MSFLTALWILSLAILVGIVVYAERRAKNISVSSDDVPTSFADFIATELTRMVGHLAQGFHHIRPHGERVIVAGGIVLKKGHDVFIEKIFGRMEIEKGNVISFFLKRIVEHKEELRKKDHEGV